jgi:hypothetical protein
MSDVLLGHWDLVSYETVGADGTVRRPYGEAIGRISYDEHGYMAGQIMRPGRAPVTQGGGGLQQVRAAYMGYIAYFGTYEVNAAGDTVVHRVQGALNPAWVGTEQVRRMRFDGDRLVLQAEVKKASGIVRHVITWKRLLAIVLMIAAAAASGCSSVKSITNSYATLAEAQKAGAVTEGWLPDGLPEQTHDIREAHVPGTTEHWGIINFPAEGEPAVRAILAEELPLQGLRCDPPGRIEWWPPMLRGPFDGERLGVTGLHAYRSKDAKLIVAVNWPQGRAYYWAAQ